MNAVSVAMAEIVREGTWALRALGYPYGTAERAASLLAWTEAVHGHGLAMLRLGEAAIAAGAARPAPGWRRDAQGIRQADAHGKCLFECGPPALDLATAAARLHGGLGRAVLRGAIGTRLSGALGAIAARRALAAVLVHAPGAAEIAPVPPPGWICALPTSEGPAFQAGSLDQALPAMLPAPLHVAAEDIAAARAAGNEGFFSIAALSCPPMEPPPGAVDWPQRLALAYRTGAQADPADLETLYLLEMRTWAPTSERSRNQAGFGRY
ncbi:MAG TPA: hypothetical protein VFE41_14345 [Acetobacteraceae bacterium]|jgi:hypothetical protein|nr:hypothetical protein [Acetobacteraceae bacterium]